MNVISLMINMLLSCLLFTQRASNSNSFVCLSVSLFDLLRQENIRDLMSKMMTSNKFLFDPGKAMLLLSY